MRKIHAAVLLILAGVLSFAQPVSARSDRASRDFRHIDIDDDGKLSRAEWLRRGNFDKLDTDKDGYLNPDEMRRNYRGALDPRPGTEPVREKRRRGERKKRDKRKEAGKSSEAAAETTLRNDPAYVDYTTLDENNLCGIKRGRDCDPMIAVGRGLLATGLGPEFPKNADCPGIDDYFALDYAYKRGRIAFHGGMDLPVPWETPVIAVADGTVVGKFKGEDSARGIELVVRHSPEETGLPVWTYSLYGHFDKMPEHDLGQHVRMGEVLGPTGNSGIDTRTGVQSTRRRPAIHFVIFYSTSEKYSERDDAIIPVDGYWMDPHAFYRKKPPFDSQTMKALPDAQKGIAVPIMFKDGETFPADTKMVWPYMCGRE